MEQKIYHIDAFANKVFTGNPAAVCPLQEWLPDELLQQIAMENNLPETAFYLKNGDDYEIRWFSPKAEVDLCGHATLASAYVLFTYENYMDNVLTFQSRRRGPLTVRREGDLIILNFPTDFPSELLMTDELRECFATDPSAVYKGKTDYLYVYNKEEDIISIQPDFHKIAKLDVRGVIVTAPGKEVDFVSRFFAPGLGIDEDPVTGSAHTTLTPYWADKLNKNTLTALQLSDRKGLLKCKLMGDRVEIAGQCTPYMVGNIFLED